MKKLGFGIVGLLLIATVYYFTAGSSQAVQEIKKQVNHELTTLQQNGFAIEQRESKAAEEHFVVSFDDPAKITNYLISRGMQANQEDILVLEGLKLGVDAKYLQDSYSALSVNIYPLKLPRNVSENTDPEDKAAVERLKKMIKEKVFLLHIDFNKLLNGFKGYVKDIHETFEGKEEKVTFTSQGFKFEGTVEKEKLKTVHQSLQFLSLDAQKAFNAKLSDITFNYTFTGPSPYDTESDHHIGEIKIQAEPGFFIHMKNLNGTAKNSVQKGLLKSTVSSKADEIRIMKDHKTYTLHNILFDLAIDKLDIAAFEAFQRVDINDTKAVNALSQKIFSKGFSVSIPNFSAEKITQDGTTMDGFDLSSSWSINRVLDINAVSQDPFSSISIFSNKTHISVSADLFAHIVKDPRAMMFIMLLPPVEKEGRKIYDIEFINGKLTVNGTSF
ncbi:MAG: hypothetical protein P794_00250 [Epsilonproteobacteria bacterium (ex Lamellibrachia satsuma)]|nr:MAG: hypothetical protein P794_00250 [Epsilonproteobacteria bacterium (ex Lamellibrachia satsuma)]